MVGNLPAGVGSAVGSGNDGDIVAGAHPSVVPPEAQKGAALPLGHGVHWAHSLPPRRRRAPGQRPPGCGCVRALQARWRAEPCQICSHSGGPARRRGQSLAPPCAPKGSAPGWLAALASQVAQGAVRCRAGALPGRWPHCPPGGGGWPSRARELGPWGARTRHWSSRDTRCQPSFPLP